MLQRVREGGNETRIVRRFTREVGVSLRVEKQDSLCRPRSALRLDPAAALAWSQRAGPQANLLRTQGRIGHFKNDAAHILVSEEVVAGELQVVLCALHVAEEGVAPPAREEAVVAGLGHACHPPHRHRCPFHNSLAAVASLGGLRALNASQRRSLPALGGRKAHPVCDIGEGIAIRVNLKLVQRFGCERLVGSGPWRVLSG